MKEESLGIVETKFFTCCEPPNELSLKSGEKLRDITLAYETYGTLNDSKTNAILIVHALTGDAHAAGLHEGDKKPGWWDSMIGPSKAFDTNKYFVICSNVIGGCQGSTGPSSINPDTKKPYGLDFPAITIEDMVSAQKLLIDHLGITKLLNVAGGSMGGLQALQWPIQFPDCIQSSIVIATNYRHSAQQIALHEVGRQAVMSDPKWNNGDYYGKERPAQGLALARMLGHITYMSDELMDEKFGRRRIEKEKKSAGFSPVFEVQNYLKYRGDSFVQRFDANSYLYITKAVDLFDLQEEGKLEEIFKNVKSNFLVISFSSDWLYPTYQLKELARALKANDINVSDVVIKTKYGHDAFLVENKGQARAVTSFLDKEFNEVRKNT